jgi:hypothetical protein
MNARELIRHTFAWEIAPGVSADVAPAEAVADEAA